MSNALLGGSVSPFGLQYGLEASRLAFIKAPVIPVAVVAAAWLLLGGKVKWDSGCGLWVSILGASTVISLLTSFKEGSHQNYWFAAQFSAFGFIAQFLASLREGMRSERIIVSVGLAICLVMMTAVQFGYLSGRLRAVAIDDHARMMTLHNSLKSMPGPVLVRGGYYENLPWITGQNEPYVLAWTYPRLREAGVPFERGGVGGLVREGAFGTIVYPLAYSANELTDGASLARYGMAKKDEYFTYFTLRESSE